MLKISDYIVIRYLADVLGRKIAFRLSFLVLISVSLIFTIALGYFYILSRQMIVDEIKKDALQLAKGTSDQINGILGAVEKIPESLSVILSETAARDKRKLMTLMRAVLERNPNIYGTAVAYEPYAWDGNLRNFSPYLFRNKSEISSILIPYDYFSWNWYKLPRQLNSTTWIEPYFDEGAGNIIMSTYSAPFYRIQNGQKIFSGVVTIDISLDWLTKIVSSIKIGKTGYAFLISKNGRFLTHPDQSMIMNKTIFNLADEFNDQQLRDVGDKMTEGHTGLVLTKSLVPGKEAWLAYTSLSSSGWSLGVLFPQDELMAGVSELYLKAMLIGVFGLIFLVGVIVWVAHSITRPLSTLTASAASIASGDLTVSIPASSATDEVGMLSKSFCLMQQSLRDYIRNLTETTAAKQRIESELKIAHDIQMGILPRVFPPFPERGEIDIYALLRPAREVGGDLYDFFFLDEDHLCFVVGDVSGKGVPAAILMAVTKILIKAKATQGLDPEIIMARANEDLAMDNPSMMFVTIFLGVLNVRKGELVYCNGGHPPPYVIRENGEILSLPATNGVALGVVEGFVYVSKTFSLKKNDALFLFSDGVTEATDEQYRLFGEPRLVEAIAEAKEKRPKELIESVLKKIDEFAQATSQADDITMMVLEYYGKNDAS